MGVGMLVRSRWIGCRWGNDLFYIRESELGFGQAFWRILEASCQAEMLAYEFVHCHGSQKEMVERRSQDEKLS